MKCPLISIGAVIESTGHLVDPMDYSSLHLCHRSVKSEFPITTLTKNIIARLLKFAGYIHHYKILSRIFLASFWPRTFFRLSGRSFVNPPGQKVLYVLCTQRLYKNCYTIHITLQLTSKLVSCLSTRHFITVKDMPA